MKKGKKLTDKQLAFCREYVRRGWNGTKAVIAAGYSPKGADVRAALLLGNVSIQQRIQYHKDHIEELLNFNRTTIIEEHLKIAQSSIAHLHNTWITRKEFEDLTDEQKACIQEISTKVEKRVSDQGEVLIEEWVKVKLYDKQKSLDAISKIMGYDAPAKHAITIDKEPQINIVMDGKTVSLKK